MASMKPEKPDEEFHGAGTSSQTTRNRGPFSAAAKVFSKSKFNVAASPFVMNSTKNEPNMRIEMSPRRSSMYAQMPPRVPYATSTPVAPQFRSILGRDPRAHHGHAVGPNLMDESIMCCFPPPPPSLIRSWDFNSPRSFGAHCQPDGTILIRLREGVSIEMTLDRAVRVINSHSKVAVALSNTGNSSALIHPNGRVYQYGSKVEIITYDGMRKNNFVRYAKMWQKGVSFTSQHCALVYLVDTAGTRTTTDSFTDMSQDLTKALFYRETRYGEEFVDDVLQVLRAASWWSNEDGSDLFDVNGFRITQTPDGLVRITNSNNKSLIRTSPGNGSATLTTNFMHCTASMGQTSHLFVRRGELRMHFDGSQFVVRNAGHSAGFDDNNRLKVY
ncbi:uncharacterized protein LOC129792838 [Lutzomyia longipalpis]|uniref:uncharacterized protein LOC129792838 n=1 Tax=Lutzomyia longipalpis TaxID=7200 RepID=UPI002483C580|nr:uncharacterized protein LOC129792838 [Lutzomyia longipalpis]